jgi:SPP1 gp7 family putative phage head morphogenesis protein
MWNYKKQILAGDDHARHNLAANWRIVMQELDGRMSAISYASAWDKLPEWKIYENQRFQDLLEQVDKQRKWYTESSLDIIQKSGRSAATLGLSHAQQLIHDSYTGSNMIGAFNIVPFEAVENMMGLLKPSTEGEGRGVIFELLNAAWPAAVHDMASALISGVALGLSPDEIARDMRLGLTGAANRTQTIARTETMRVYRSATQQQYIESGVVEYMMRVSTRDRRVCPTCMIMDGEVIQLHEEMAEHPNGRCTLIPKLIGGEVPEWQKGRDWFFDQDEETQKAILGKQRWELYDAGKFELNQLVNKATHPIYGSAYQVVTVKDLKAGNFGTVNVGKRLDTRWAVGATEDASRWDDAFKPTPTAPPKKTRTRKIVTPTAPPVTGTTPVGAPVTGIPAAPTVVPDPQINLEFTPDQQLKDVVVGKAENLLQQHGIFRKQAEDAMADLVKDKDLRIEVKTATMKKVVKSGRFMSQFESGASGGYLSPSFRAEAEEKGVGFPQNADAKKRPIYGYVDIGKERVSSYGDISVVLKPEVKARTTITMGDSLGGFSAGAQLATPILKPGIEGIGDTYLMSNVANWINTRDNKALIDGISYVEMQVQGGVSLSDIAYVHDHSGRLDDKTKKAFEKAGLEIRTHPR